MQGVHSADVVLKPASVCFLDHERLSVKRVLGSRIVATAALDSRLFVIAKSLTVTLRIDT